MRALPPLLRISLSSSLITTPARIGTVRTTTDDAGDTDAEN
jgi:hypothetical protein